MILCNFFRVAFSSIFLRSNSFCSAASINGEGIKRCESDKGGRKGGRKEGRKRGKESRREREKEAEREERREGKKE